MFKAKKAPKLKKGKWFYKVRGSYLPGTPEGWFLHSLLLFCGVCVIITAADDERSVLIMLTTTFLQLVGLGALFTIVAARKS